MKIVEIQDKYNPNKIWLIKKKSEQKLYVFPKDMRKTNLSLSRYHDKILSSSF